MRLQHIVLTAIFGVSWSPLAMAGDEWRAEYYVNELNKISAALRYNPTHMTVPNTDLVLNVGCAMLKTAIEENVAKKISQFLDGSPESRTWEATNEATFEGYEASLFERFGANVVTISLLRASILRASIETEPYSRSEWQSRLDDSNRDPARLERALKGTVRKACTIAQKSSPSTAGQPQADAKAVPSSDDKKISESEPETIMELHSQRSALAYQVGKAALGVTVMAVDAAATISFPHIAVMTLSIASGGWGWNRVEEAYFEIIKQQ